MDLLIGSLFILLFKLVDQRPTECELMCSCDHKFHVADGWKLFEQCERPLLIWGEHEVFFEDFKNR